MRLRLLVIAALVALAVPTVAVARTAKGSQKAAAIAGTWDVQVSPVGASPFPALLTFTRDGGVIETESDGAGTGLGSWKRTGPKAFTLAFKTFLFTPAGDPAGSVVVRAAVTLNGGTLSGPFKFDVFDTAGNKLQSGSGTAKATRFVIPPF
jgi:hypothetical protein